MLIFKKLLDFHAKTNQEPHLKMCVFHFSEKNTVKGMARQEKIVRLQHQPMKNSLEIPSTKVAGKYVSTAGS